MEDLRTTEHVDHKGQNTVDSLLGRESIDRLLDGGRHGVHCERAVAKVIPEGIKASLIGQGRLLYPER